MPLVADANPLGVLSRSVSHKVLALKKRAPVLVGALRPATPRRDSGWKKRTGVSPGFPQPPGDADPRFQTRRVSSAVLRSGESGISDQRRWRKSPVLDSGRHAGNRLASFFGGR